MKSNKFNYLENEYIKKINRYRKLFDKLGKELSIIKVRKSKSIDLRIAYIDARIKKIPSLIQKAIKLEINGSEVFEKINDIFGYRVVVNNLFDVDILINEIEKLNGLIIILKKKHEEENGYRAVHLIVEYGDENSKNKLTSEIQIRTLLQDAWAIISHHDIYRNQSEMPLFAKSISEGLSESFKAQENLSNKFRVEMKKHVIPPNDLSEEAPLDKLGITYLYYKIFGKNPEEYEVHFLKDVAEKHQLKTISDAEIGLKREVFEKLNTIHDNRFQGFDIGKTELFEYGLKFAASGSSAYDDYEKDIEREWNEINEHGRREVLSELPETLEDFLKILETNSIDRSILDAIKELGGIGSCERCGNPILKPESAAEAILDYYDRLDFEEDLSQSIMEISCIDCPECEDIFNPGLCPYCGNLMSKDD